MLSQEQLRELEWAATYLQNNKPRKGCRCGGSCETCRAFRQQRDKITPNAVLELIKHIRQIST